MPPIPDAKALLSADGGICPRDGACSTSIRGARVPHRCPTCGAAATGERHDRAWARFQHLWLAERSARLSPRSPPWATIPRRASARSRSSMPMPPAIFEYPNRDNVLGPSRLFFSTYLESIWITNYLAAAATAPRGRSLPEPRPPRASDRGRRGGQPDRRVRRGILQPADLAQRGAGRDRRLVRGRGAVQAARWRLRPA